MTTRNQQPTITIYGNVGKNPEIKTIRSQDRTVDVYDPIIDDTVERHFPGEEKELRTFSIAVNAKNPETNEEITRWVRCTDWKGLSKLLRQGDRVAVKGFFRETTYEKDGEQKTAKDFQVQAVSVQKRKVREQAQ